MLKGKAKRLFKLYYSQYTEECEKKKETLLFKTYNYFEKQPISVRWGVYQDFADSLGYSLIIQQDGKTYYAELSLMDYDIEIGNLLFESEWLDTRNEAREQAIKQLNKLINNN